MYKPKQQRCQYISVSGHTISNFRIHVDFNTKPFNRNTASKEIDNIVYTRKEQGRPQNAVSRKSINSVMTTTHAVNIL